MKNLKLFEEFKLNEARSIGKVNIKKLNKAILDAWNKNHDVTEDEIIEQLPTAWWDIWEAADDEIRRIIYDQLLNLTHEGKLKESINEADFQGWTRYIASETTGLPKNGQFWADGHQIFDGGGDWIFAFYKGTDQRKAKDWVIVTDDGGYYKVGAQYMIWWTKDGKLRSNATWSEKSLNKILGEILSGKEPSTDPDYQT